jgi:hypothetical protein
LRNVRILSLMTVCTNWAKFWSVRTANPVDCQAVSHSHSACLPPRRAARCCGPAAQPPRRAAEG